MHNIFGGSGGENIMCGVGGCGVGGGSQGRERANALRPPPPCMVWYGMVYELGLSASLLACVITSESPIESTVTPWSGQHDHHLLKKTGARPNPKLKRATLYSLVISFPSE